MANILHESGAMQDLSSTVPQILGVHEVPLPNWGGLGFYLSRGSFVNFVADMEILLVA